MAMHIAGSYKPLEDRLPEVPLELIKALRAEFPQRLPSPNEGDRQIWMHVGEQMLLDTLLSVAIAQAEKSENKHTPPQPDFNVLTQE